MEQYPTIPWDPVTEVYLGHPVTDPYRYLQDPADPRTTAAMNAGREYTHHWFSRHGFDIPAMAEKLKAGDTEPVWDMGEMTGGKRGGVQVLSNGKRKVYLLNDAMEPVTLIADEEMLGNRMEIYSAQPCPCSDNIWGLLTVLHGHPRMCAVIWDADTHSILYEKDDVFDLRWSLDGEELICSPSCEIDGVMTHRVLRINRHTGAQCEVYRSTENAVLIRPYDVQKGTLCAVMRTYNDVRMDYVSPEGHITSLNDGNDLWKYIGCHNEQYFFVTNHDAPMQKVVSLTHLDTEMALQTTAFETVPMGEWIIECAGVTSRGILLNVCQHGCASLTLYPWNDPAPVPIPLPDSCGVIWAVRGIDPEFHEGEDGKVLFAYESFLQKKNLLSLDIASLTLQGATIVSTDGITVEQKFITARDGTKLLAYLVRPTDLQKSGDAPAIFHGYGGYGASLTPEYNLPVIGIPIRNWVQQGGIYIHCIIRGGSEYGQKWHEDAMGMKKRNAFCDFIDIGKAILEEGWTCPEKMIACGWSNGGLLMTAVATMEPELFGTIIAGVPHTDMLRFARDPRGPMYTTEYGDPNSSEEMFLYMRDYSPYHAVRPGVRYPRLYIQTGELDNNVPPYHGMKFAFRVQAEASNENPCLLQVLPHGSHDQGTGDEHWQNVAQMLAFIGYPLDE